MGVLRELFENRGDYMDGEIIDPDTGEVFLFDSLIGDDTPEDAETATGNSGEWSKTDNRIDHARDMADKIRHALQD